MEFSSVWVIVGNVFMTYDKRFEHVSKDLKIEIDSLDKVFDPYDIDANLGKIDIPEVWGKMCNQLNIKNGRDYDIVTSWISDYETIPSMHYLAKLIAEKYKVGVISNCYNDYFEGAKQQKFIPEINFDPVIISAEVECMKPEPEICKIAEERCGYKGDEIFYIDDKKENLFAASKFGWQTFLMDYKNVEKSVEEIGRTLL